MEQIPTPPFRGPRHVERLRVVPVHEVPCPAQAAERIGPAVVRVDAKAPNGKPAGQGSGFFFDSTGRVLTTYRPDSVVDPDFEDFAGNLDRLGEITGCDTGTWAGYLDAHRSRRAFFKQFGATSSDQASPRTSRGRGS